MSFVEFRFLWFFLAVFIVYWTMRNNPRERCGFSSAAIVFTRLGTGNLHSWFSGPRRWITSSDKCSDEANVRHGGASGLPPAYASISVSWLFSNTLTFLYLWRPGFWRGLVCRQA